MRSFSQVTRIELQKEFGLSIDQGKFLPSVEPLPVPSWLVTVLSFRKESLATMRTEKSISEALIAPVLMAVEDKFRDKISIFSGEPLVTEVLSGICDFLITKDPTAFDPEGGYFVLVESKKQDLLSGVPRCVAEMYAAQILNGNDDTVYGCVSIGVEWLFIKLEGKLPLLTLQFLQLLRSIKYWVFLVG